MKRPLQSGLMILLLLITPLLLTAQNNEKTEITVSQWLKLGPVETSLPVYHDQENIRSQTFGLTQLLGFEPVQVSDWRPAAGLNLTWSANKTLTWQSEETESVVFSNITGYANGWIAFYVSSDRYTKAELSLSSHHPFKVYINGHSAGTKSASNSADGDAGTHTEKLTLTTGKHLVLIRTLKDADNDAAWEMNGKLTHNSEASVVISSDPVRMLDLETLSNQPGAGSLAISADGSLAAVRISKPSTPEGTTESWLEIRETRNGNLFRAFKGGMDFGSLQWAPTGRKFTFTESSGGKTTLWLADLETGDQKKIIQGIESFGSYRWSPTGDFILYTITENPSPNTTGVRLIDDLEERRPWHFARSFIYRLNIAAGTTQRLTAGLLSTNLLDISADGKKILFSRSHTDYSERPFTRAEYQILNIETLETDSLFTVTFGGGGQFSPDGQSILFTGGPSMFGELGTNIPDGMTANDYDGQAYIYDLRTRSPRAISRDFDSSIEMAMWGADSNTIFMITTEKSFTTAWSHDVRRGNYTKLNTSTDVTGQFVVARNGRTAVYSGTGISSPVTVHTLDLQRNRSALLVDPGFEYFSGVQFGTARNWTFTSSDGTEIDGHFYLPPDFNETKTYPVIVYYYGGTVPVNRAFGGRYPKELYAAKGYIVYVLQPSGATGFGQEFSARHVNDWGIRVADEIIEGTEKFLDAHSFADRDRVGAIGASYGGFMTMLLMTRTDIFAAGISHAGISNIASYWGEGFWGYQYSAIATANSFPWNRRDIYVDQSPLYSADKVNTPLLFVTGMSDTNVPPGESLQMYTALKLLGKETAFIGFDDQDHHIVDYKKYKVWKQSIIAWFDKYLKDQSDWWEEMYD